MEFEKTLTRYKLAGITLVIFNFTSFHLCSSCVFFHHHISFPTRNRNTLAYNRSACSQCQCLQFLLSFVKQSHHHCEGHKFKSCSNQEYFSGVFYTSKHPSKHYFFALHFSIFTENVFSRKGSKLHMTVLAHKNF